MGWNIRPYDDAKDWERVLEMGYSFAASLDIAEATLEDPSVFAAALHAVVNDTDNFTCLVYVGDDDIPNASIAWLTSPYLWNPKIVNTAEVFFYNQGAGPRAAMRLLGAYEEEAKRQGVRLLNLTLLATSDPRVAKMYERRGASLSETTYMKEI